MPTNRTRYMITESDSISECLEDAALLWPDCPTKIELLKMVLNEGSKVVALRAKPLRVNRAKALQRLVSAGTGMWPENFDELRKQEWPE